MLVEHRDRFSRFEAEYVEAALSAQSRRLIAVDSAEGDDDLVRDATESLTTLCARLYGPRLASNRSTGRQLDASQEGVHHGAANEKQLLMSAKPWSWNVAQAGDHCRVV